MTSNNSHRRLWYHCQLQMNKLVIHNTHSTINFQLRKFPFPWVINGLKRGTFQIHSICMYNDIMDDHKNWNYSNNNNNNNGTQKDATQNEMHTPTQNIIKQDHNVLAFWLAKPQYQCWSKNTITRSSFSVAVEKC